MSEHHKEREAAYFRAPFSVSPNVSADNRIPNALEYIAANIGIIARILERAEADGRLGAASIGELARTAPQTQAGTHRPHTPEGSRWSSLCRRASGGSTPRRPGGTPPFHPLRCLCRPLAPVVCRIGMPPRLDRGQREGTAQRPALQRLRNGHSGYRRPHHVLDWQPLLPPRRRTLSACLART